VVETATSPATANPPVAAGKKKEKKGLLIGLVIFLVLSTGGSALAYWFYSEIHRDGQSFTDFYLWQAGLKEWKEEKPAVTASDTEETKEGTTTKPVVPPISAPISKPVSTPAVTPAATGVIKDFWYDGNGDIYDVNADQYFLVYTDQEYYYNPTTKKVFLATTTALTPVAVPGFTVFYNAATGLMIALPKGWEKVKVVEETPTGDTAPFEDPVYMKFYLPTTGTAVGSLPGYCATFGIIATSLDSYDTLMADPEASAALNFLGTFGDYGFVETEPDGPFPTDVQVRLTEVPDILSDGISAHEML